MFVAASGSVRSFDITIARRDEGDPNSTARPTDGTQRVQGNCLVDEHATAVLVNPDRLFHRILWLPKGETSLTSTQTGPIIHVIFYLRLSTILHVPV